MAVETLKYNIFTPEEWEKVKQFFSAKGTEITTDEGELDSYGVNIHYLYNPDLNRLTVDVSHTPFWLSEKEVSVKLDHAIQLAAARITVSQSKEE